MIYVPFERKDFSPMSIVDIDTYQYFSLEEDTRS